jgi:hypothetical protein
MKYKAIKSAAHNFGDSFASGLNYAAGDYIMSHLARRVLACGRTEMTVDLMTGEAGPAELVAPPVEQSIAGRVGRLPRWLASQRIDPGAIRAGRMRIAFDPSRCTTAAPTDGYAIRDIPFDCWVEIVDDRDRTHAAHFRRWWSFAADGPGSGLGGQRQGRWRRLVRALASGWDGVRRRSPRARGGS